MTDPNGLIQAAKNLSLKYAQRSDEIEKARRIPADIALEMGQAGFYRMGIPASVGGLETEPAISSEVIEILARGDASCAWTAFIGVTSGTTLAAIRKDDATEVLSTPETLITGVFAPTGRADKVDGGFNVSGRWQWGSGSQNAAWVLGGTLLMENDEPMLDRKGNPRSHMVLMPANEVEFLDTWHVSGLRGTGSLDYQVENLFVPESKVVGYLPTGEAARSALSKFPNFTFLALGIAAVSLGIARAAIDDLVELATAKKRVGARKTVAEQQISQVKLAEAEASLRSARLFYYEGIREAWGDAIAGNPVSLEKRRNLRLATSHAVKASVGVVEDMYELGGGSAVYETSRLQRHFRDINVARSHIMVAQGTFETIGSLFFGLETNTSRL